MDVTTLPAYSGFAPYCPTCEYNHPQSSQSNAAAAKYCESDCIPNGQNGFVSDVWSLGSSPTPHLHRTCPFCGRNWLERTA